MMVLWTILAAAAVIILLLLLLLGGISLLNFIYFSDKSIVKRIHTHVYHFISGQQNEEF